MLSEVMRFGLAECWSRRTASYIALRMARRSSRPRARRSPLDGFARYLRFLNKPRRGRHSDPEDGGVPVEPNRPNTLSGGAAAELEFDD